MTRQRWRDLAVAVSLANLWYVGVWADLFRFLKTENQYVTSPPSPVPPTMAAIGVVVLGAAFFAAIRVARRWGPGTRPRRLAVAGFLLLVAVAANAFRLLITERALETSLPAGMKSGLAVIIASVLASAVWMFGLERVGRWTSAAVLVMLPFVVMTFGQAAWLVWASTDVEAFRDKAPAPAIGRNTAQPRVIFVVFDGLDQHLLTDEREPGLALPEFERFWASAVHWRNAYPPSNSTLLSFPMLIGGTPVHKVRRIAPNELALQFDSRGPFTPWSEQPNLFTRARAMGIDSALIGWYHPYCRVIGDDVSRCRWYAIEKGVPPTAGENIRLQTVQVLRSIPGVGHLHAVTDGRERARSRVLWHARQYGAIRDEALQAAADGRFGLVFVHFPIPHNPFIFDRATRSMRSDRGGSYTDNLALVDLTLEELRATLQKTGLWDRTALIITSDHWYRRPGWKERDPAVFPKIGKADHRVPLILRLPGQHTPVIDPRPVLAIASHELALAILRGDLKTSADLERVLTGLPRWMRPDPTDTAAVVAP